MKKMLRFCNNLFNKRLGESRRYISMNLSELLITIGIIGVVAAFLFPIVSNSYWDFYQKNQFRKVYSELSNLLIKIRADVGYTPRCYGWLQNPYLGRALICKTYDEYGSCTKVAFADDGSSLPNDYDGPIDECKSVFYPALANSTKIIKYCSSKAYNNGCITQYNSAPGKNQTSIYGSISIANSPAYIFADGSTMVVVHGSYPWIFVDINGAKKPNKWGWDLFYFSINAMPNSNQKLVPLNNPVENGGTSTAEMVKKL